MIFENKYIKSSLLSLVGLVCAASCNTEEVATSYAQSEPYVHGDLQVLEDEYFPYTLTEDINLTVNITTTGGEAMNNKKLGMNSTLLDTYVSASGYDSDNSKDFITYAQPSVMRFPNGVYGNFYNWKDDNRYLPTYTGESGSTQSVNTTQPNWEYSDHESAGQQGHITLGVNGLTQLQKSLGYDILWIWCMNHVDGTMEKLVSGKQTEDSFFTDRDNNSVMFYQDSDGKEYSFKQALIKETTERYNYYTNTLYADVECVELGNEPFFKSQMSALSSSVKLSSWSRDYAVDAIVVKTIAETLRELNPNIKLAAPYSWRRGSGNSVSVDTSNHYAYNNHYLTNMSDYYDAMVLHKYVKPGVSSVSARQSLLTVRRDYQADFKYFWEFEPDKEIWMTEWSIGGSDNTSPAVTVLSLADLYLYLFSEKNLTHIEYFQAHGAANPFFIDSGASNALVMTKTGFGAVHEILRGMFTSSTTLTTELTGAPLFYAESEQQWNYGTHTLDAVYGVSAKAVKQADGHYALLLVNKTNREASLKIQFDGEDYEQDYIYEYLSYDNLLHEKTWSQTAEVLTMLPYRDGDLILKPYSITKISEFRLPDAPDPTY